MIVYVVLFSYYDDNDVCAVFDSLEKAENYIKNKILCDRKFYDIITKEVE